MDSRDDLTPAITRIDDEPEPEPEPSSPSLEARLKSLGRVVGLFLVAIGVSLALTRFIGAMVGIGEPGTAARLFTNTVALQIGGFGLGCLLFLWAREVDWRSYLRLDEISDWILFYGAAVGLSLMILTVLVSGLFTVLELETAESSTGASQDPLYYLLLFVISSFVAVPLEEAFFRGILQRHLEELYHPVAAILVPSLLFMSIHGIRVERPGDVLALGLFFGFGVILGTSYYLTQNLYVPVIGHVMFNGIQILVRALQVAV
jgi:membrane protease YdiL (CAAX protease family)